MTEAIRSGSEVILGKVISKGDCDPAIKRIAPSITFVDPGRMDGFSDQISRHATGARTPPYHFAGRRGRSANVAECRDIESGHRRARHAGTKFAIMN